MKKYTLLIASLIFILMFGPTSNALQNDTLMTRGEFIKMLITLHDEKWSNRLCDISRRSEDSKYICRAKDLGIIKRGKQNKFYPQKYIKVAYALEMAYRAYHLFPSRLGHEKIVETNMRFATNLRLLPMGIKGGNAILTRGQASELITRLNKYQHNQLDAYLSPQTPPTAPQPAPISIPIPIPAPIQTTFVPLPTIAPTPLQNPVIAPQDPPTQPTFNPQPATVIPSQPVLTPPPSPVIDSPKPIVVSPSPVVTPPQTPATAALPPLKGYDESAREYEAWYQLPNGFADWMIKNKSFYEKAFLRARASKHFVIAVYYDHPIAYNPPWQNEAEHMQALKTLADLSFPTWNFDFVFEGDKKTADATVYLGENGPYSFAYEQDKTVHLIYETIFDHEFAHLLGISHHYEQYDASDAGNCTFCPPGEGKCIMDRTSAEWGASERFAFYLPMDVHNEAAISKALSDILDRYPKN